MAALRRRSPAAAARPPQWPASPALLLLTFLLLEPHGGPRLARAWPAAAARALLHRSPTPFGAVGAAGRDRRGGSSSSTAVAATLVNETVGDGLVAAAAAAVGGSGGGLAYDDDEADAPAPRSAFGTRAYWDDVYSGRGDFAAEEYSWYYGYDEIRRLLPPELVRRKDRLRVLVPGVGNDPILLDLWRDGYRRLAAQDYSAPALDRQRDLLRAGLGGDDAALGSIELEHGDVLGLAAGYRNRFDLVLEKGLLDAVYLSGEGRVERAAAALAAALAPGGHLVSVSGVVPEELRRRLFGAEGWHWLRDGSGDLRAGCFIFRKKETQDTCE